MAEPYFGIPQSFVRQDHLKGLSGAATKLYVVLWHESERYSTRELTRSASQLTALTKMHRNSIAKAQKELANARLVTADPFGEKGFVYQLCDPTTGKPWPGRPDVKVDYVKKPVTGYRQSRPRSTNSELAGTGFPFGANVVGQNGSSPSASPAASPATPVYWNDITRDG
ncbi:MAG TPA: hypothetical protein VF753_09075 [Terriglobales bacterium]